VCTAKSNRDLCGKACARAAPALRLKKGLCPGEPGAGMDRRHSVPLHQLAVSVGTGMSEI